MSLNVFQRETSEFQPVTITQNGTTITQGVAFSIVPAGQRPATFTAATILNGRTGFMVQGYAAGDYQAWAQVTAAPEAPVLNCGTFRVL